MMRLIDADALEKSLTEKGDDYKVSMFATADDCNIARLVAFECAEEVKNSPTIEAEPVRIDGNTSDGYHTFNELYHHRAVLFSVIVKAFHQKAWKSRKHHDGTMFDRMFIVGIETPDGQATYHYDLEPYWDMFNCNEVEFAPEWDGHTPQQAIERIGKLEPVRTGKWERRRSNVYCTNCGTGYRIANHGPNVFKFKRCPNCGAKMRGEDDE